MRHFFILAIASALSLPPGAQADTTSDAIHSALNDRFEIEDAPVAIDIVYEPALPAALADNASPMSLRDFRFDRMSGRFSAVVAPLDDSTARTSVGGYVKATVEVPVVRRSVQRGELIADADIDYVTMPAAGLTKGLVLDPGQLAGKAAKRTLHADRAVRAVDLMAPILIARNSNVSMIYVVGTLQITARGRALSDAGAGDTILVLNTSSKKTVEAVVLDANTVAVGNTPQIVQQ
ncbi:MAG: flagellar basal body P-ring formation chaperone FlgA [Dongiaceae bacterium]